MDRFSCLVVVAMLEAFASRQGNPQANPPALSRSHLFPASGSFNEPFPDTGSAENRHSSPRDWRLPATLSLTRDRSRRRRATIKEPS
ncbi:hypothetical protein HNP46_001727 [Pseudomonas nitritireducens]|uniref:Uncharacterized protein n=1 Tax=Pseudomonas nitroreducens TaxID=46680 RepID=A0A7W7P123_PSENT|nr:hypothetical protein [Pseudomonas nitritireducens]